MLIQITNKCYEGCEHCMQCSNPDGKHMDELTFKNALRFARFLKTEAIIISGGEPTLHPDFFRFCQYLDQYISDYKLVMGFCITSNGSWFPKMTEDIEELAKLKNYIGMQVYTNPKWYKSNSYIMEHRDEISRIPKVMVDTTDIRSMQDLGRAKTSEKAMREVKSNPHFMSCLNGHLIFKQMSIQTKMAGMGLVTGVQCKPMVDYKGNVHLSESCCCPSFGNVNEDFMMNIYSQLKASKPCCQCELSKKFLSTSDPNIAVARKLMGFK